MCMLVISIIYTDGIVIISIHNLQHFNKEREGMGGGGGLRGSSPGLAVVMEFGEGEVLGQKQMMGGEGQKERL